MNTNMNMNNQGYNEYSDTDMAMMNVGMSILEPSINAINNNNLSDDIDTDINTDINTDIEPSVNTSNSNSLKLDTDFSIKSMYQYLNKNLKHIFIKHHIHL